MAAPPPDSALHDLVSAIDRRSLRTSVRLMVDLIAPFGIIAGNVVLFVQPFLAQSRWRQAIAPLMHEQGWAQLQQLLADDDD